MATTSSNCPKWKIFFLYKDIYRGVLCSIVADDTKPSWMSFGPLLWPATGRSCCCGSAPPPRCKDVQLSLPWLPWVPWLPWLSWFLVHSAGLHHPSPLLLSQLIHLHTEGPLSLTVWHLDVKHTLFNTPLTVLWRPSHSACLCASLPYWFQILGVSWWVELGQSPAHLGGASKKA